MGRDYWGTAGDALTILQPHYIRVCRKHIFFCHFRKPTNVVRKDLVDVLVGFSAGKQTSILIVAGYNIDASLICVSSSSLTEKLPRF